MKYRTKCDILGSDYKSEFPALLPAGNIVELIERQLFVIVIQKQSFTAITIPENIELIS